jgi:hypothetical protein
MIKKVLIGILAALVIIAGLLTYLRSATKKHSPEATATYQNKGLDMVVKYCQPYKKNRIIFGDESTGALQPYGKYWRLGANEATTFNTKTAILVGDKTLPAGLYAMYAVPNEKTWTIAFNTENDRWGATAPAIENDVLRVDVPTLTDLNTTEQFVINFESNDTTLNLTLNWDNVKVYLPIAPAK